MHCASFSVWWLRFNKCLVASVVTVSGGGVNELQRVNCWTLTVDVVFRIPVTHPRHLWRLFLSSSKAMSRPRCQLLRSIVNVPLINTKWPKKNPVGDDRSDGLMDRNPGRAALPAGYSRLQQIHGVCGRWSYITRQQDTRWKIQLSTSDTASRLRLTFLCPSLLHPQLFCGNTLNPSFVCLVVSRVHKKLRVDVHELGKQVDCGPCDWISAGYG